jgi:HEAT repeat protein
VQTPLEQRWFWETAAIVVLLLVASNVLLLAAVHGRRVRSWVRGRRAARFRQRVEELFAELDSPSHDAQWLRAEVSRFNELERPIAAAMLIERMKPASDEERERTLAVLRENGVVDLLLHATRRRVPWRRAMAIRTLGWIGAAEAVPVLLERLSDRNRSVREAAFRALGRIGDVRALPRLANHFREPGGIGPGVVYDALVELGAPAAAVFAGALRSPIETVRVASCFGVSALYDPESARPLLSPLLADEAAAVRAAAAETLGQIGGDTIPEALARASRDEEPSVRRAAVTALGSYDDPQAVEFALGALADPDRDTAVRAAESLVRLTRLHLSGEAATRALERSRGAWPVERTLIFTSLGAV